MSSASDLSENEENNYSDSDISVPSDDDSDDEIPLIQLAEHQKNEWSENLHGIRTQQFEGNPGPTSFLSEDKYEIDFFEQIFKPEIYEDLARETNMYAVRKMREKPDEKWREVTVADIKAYIGFQIVMGVIIAPRLDDYFSTDEMFGICGIKHRINRDRFDKINQYFHAADTSMNPPRGDAGHDKIAHVRPVLEKVRTSLSSAYRPHRESTIDEAMVAYTGRLSIKQYVPMKPTKRGIKVWVRADPHNGLSTTFRCTLERKTTQESMVLAKE
ncbi:piggyBac transposable element-derived protein 4-like [Mercenaria mercenaria]|uniref:piggyBac transposable element-derived protein 4-like n=1 Tax=Mercenaria mercenaria TaxID=6596 RepID=UPI00234F36DD|nr:piggyBac transposable element-derived protein 4-like [Mercenaria mercenaria]